MDNKKACSNRHDCPCTATNCQNYKRCCDCVANHQHGPSLPACLRESFMLKPEKRLIGK